MPNYYASVVRLASLAALLTTLSGAAAAQQQQQDFTRIPPLKVGLQGQKITLFASQSDTVRAAQKLTVQDSVVVVGRFEGRWAVVQRSQQQYLLSVRHLTPASKAAFLTAPNLLSIDAPYDLVTRRIIMTEVVQATGASKAELYARALEWAKLNGARVQSSDKNPDELVLAGDLRARIPSGFNAGVVDYTLSLYFKDGRYKYVLTNLAHTLPGGPNYAVLAGGALENENVRIAALNGLRSWQSLRRNAVEDAQMKVGDLKRQLGAAPGKAPSDF